jgi:hypothetical protein
MTKLSSKQAEGPAGACERVVGVTVLPPTLKGRRRKSLVTCRLARGDVREVPQDGEVAAGVGSQPGGVALVNTTAGREAIGRLPDSSAAAAFEPAGVASDAMGLRADADAPAGAAMTFAAEVVLSPKATKQTLILDLLARPSGASLAELTAAAAWLPHTVRAALVRLRQKGHAIERNRDAEGVSRYRLAGDGAAAASSPATAAA